jgi:hypothetical protein
MINRGAPAAGGQSPVTGELSETRLAAPAPKAVLAVQSSGRLAHTTTMIDQPHPPRVVRRLSVLV